MNASLKDDFERFTRERGEGGRGRRRGRLTIQGYLTTHSLFSSNADDGGQKKPRKPSHDLDTESDSVFYLVFFQQPSLAVCVFKWIEDEYPGLA